MDVDVLINHQQTPLRWRHNGHDGVSNHQPHHCLLNRLFGRRSKKTSKSSASLAFVRGIHRRPVNSPHKWPVTRKMFPFDDVIMLYWLWRMDGSLSSTRKDLSATCATLTHPPLDNMAAISQTTFSDAFSWMNSFFYFDTNFTEVCS